MLELIGGRTVLAVALCVLGAGPWRVNRRTHSRRARSSASVSAARSFAEGVQLRMCTYSALVREGHTPKWIRLTESTWDWGNPFVTYNLAMLADYKDINQLLF